MKKIVMALILSSVLGLASETTINSTMSLMTQGMNQIQNGFLYSKREDVKAGIVVLENANAIFSEVDVSVFIKHNNKVQVTKNISNNLSEHLKTLKEAIEKESYTDATKAYGGIIADCISCHRIVRGW
ncbi:MAG: cytochrome C [Sulfurimonas sp.]|uniref:cytochrome C n=1 Tax=Sulfurimonas sp. TaxID=2022749 RepID=UPI0025CF974E|nr:cytochrome C [Sulfurimonas sp.]MCK9491709.1 cytochrome C [Sulfurimonas sp.]